MTGHLTPLAAWVAGLPLPGEAWGTVPPEDRPTHRWDRDVVDLLAERVT